MPWAQQLLAWCREQTGPVLENIALANGADPNEGEIGNMRKMAASCCDGIAYALSEAEKHSGIVRTYYDSHPEQHGQVAPDDVKYSWQRFISAMVHAEKELKELRQVIVGG